MPAPARLVIVDCPNCGDRHGVGQDAACPRCRAPYPTEDDQP